MSSEDEYFDSDNVDSDIEAELYSAIHYSSDIRLLEDMSQSANDSVTVITPPKTMLETNTVKARNSDCTSSSKDLFTIDVGPTTSAISNFNKISSNFHSDLLPTKDVNALKPSNPIEFSCKRNTNNKTKSWNPKPSRVDKSKSLTTFSKAVEVSESSTSSSDEELSIIEMKLTKSAKDSNGNRQSIKNLNNFSNGCKDSDSSFSSTDEEPERKKTPNRDYSYFKNLKSVRKLYNNFSKVPDDSDSSLSSLSPQHNSMKKVKSNSSSDVEILSDSDSSVIVASPEVVEKNVDTVCLGSSDSESELSDSEPSNLNISLNVSGPQDVIQWSIGDNKEEFWKINYEDAFPHRNQGRYHSGIDYVCESCGRKGHTSNFCNNKNSSLGRDIKCYICGGSHFAHYCKEKICFNCFEPGHNTCSSQSTTLCNKCLMLGHDDSVCPDIWRRYHLTTENGSFIESKETSNQKKSTVYCSNCGARGHYNAQCAYPVMDPRFYPTKPVVLPKQTEKQNYSWKVAALRKQLYKRKLKESNPQQSRQQKFNSYRELKNADSKFHSTSKQTGKYKNGFGKQKSPKQSKRNKQHSQEDLQLKNGNVSKQKSPHPVGQSEGVRNLSALTIEKRRQEKKKQKILRRLQRKLNKFQKRMDM